MSNEKIGARGPFDGAPGSRITMRELYPSRDVVMLPDLIVLDMQGYNRPGGSVLYEVVLSEADNPFAKAYKGKFRGDIYKKTNEYAQRMAFFDAMRKFVEDHFSDVDVEKLASDRIPRNEGA